MNNLVIFGAGGLAREVANVAEAINDQSCGEFIPGLPIPTNKWRIMGFVESDSTKIGSQVGRYKILCSEEELFGPAHQGWISTNNPVYAVIGIGTPKIIQKIAVKLSKFGDKVKFPTLIHPSSIGDFERISIGEGNVITAGNIFTTDIKIGSFNIINLGCTYGHDAEIGSYNVINPGATISGNVKIGNGCLIGTKATILEGRIIGDGATVGGGAVVTKDVEPGVTVVGVPAKPLVR